MAKPDPVAFRVEVMLVQNEEYQVAFGYSEIVGDYCVAEKWATDETWFHSHPILTKGKMLSLIVTNMDGTNHEALTNLGMKLGFMLLRAGKMEVQDGPGTMPFPFSHKKIDPRDAN